MLAEAVRGANGAVEDAIREDPTLRGNGCSLAVLRLAEGTAYVAWLGDTIVYRLRGNTLELLTEPRTLANDAIRQGKVRPDDTEALARFPSVIVRAVGIGATADVDTRATPTLAGDLYALVTDGIAAALGDSMIGMTLRARREDLEACVRELIDNAVVNGGRDTLAAVVVRVHGLDEAEVASTFGRGAALASKPSKLSSPTARGFRIRVNEAIGAAEVRVIAADGAMLGVMSREEALRTARASGLDLVEVNPKVQPPVCKVIDFTKYNYDAKRKAAEASRQSEDDEL